MVVSKACSFSLVGPVGPIVPVGPVTVEGAPEGPVFPAGPVIVEGAPVFSKLLDDCIKMCAMIFMGVYPTVNKQYCNVSGP